MSTKQVSTSNQQQTQSGSSQGGYQNIFDPQSMTRYQSAQGQALSGLQGFAGSPFSNPYFQMAQGMLSNRIGQQGQTQTQQLLNNARNMGFGSNSPYLQSLLAQQGRSQAGQQAQGFGGLLQSMFPIQMQALGMLQGGFNPLQTGGTQQQSYIGKGTQSGQQTQQTSGLGTWLSPLIQGGLGLASRLMGGGLGAFGKSAAGQGGTSPGNISGGLFNMGMPNMGSIYSGGGSSPWLQGIPQGNFMTPQMPSAFGVGGSQGAGFMGLPTTGQAPSMFLGQP